MSEIMVKVITLEERDKHCHSTLLTGATKEGLLKRPMAISLFFKASKGVTSKLWVGVWKVGNV